MLRTSGSPSRQFDNLTARSTRARCVVASLDVSFSCFLDRFPFFLTLSCGPLSKLVVKSLTNFCLVWGILVGHCRCITLILTQRCVSTPLVGYNSTFFFLSLKRKCLAKAELKQSVRDCYFAFTSKFVSRLYH